MLLSLYIYNRIILSSFFFCLISSQKLYNFCDSYRIEIQRIERWLDAYKAPVLPLNYIPVGRAGVEPASVDFQSTALTLWATFPNDRVTLSHITPLFYPYRRLQRIALPHRLWRIFAKTRAIRYLSGCVGDKGFEPLRLLCSPVGFEPTASTSSANLP